MKLYLDPGHGGRDPGAVGNGLQEKEVVLDLAKRIEQMLLGYSRAEVKLSRSSDITKSLTARTNEANKWGADFFLSLHCNAFNGNARGYEDFVFNKLHRNAVTLKHQKTLHNMVANQIGLPNRGMKKANFHVLRESNMPAVLTENGFIDNPDDARLMKQEAWRIRTAAAYVDGLVKMFNLKKVRTIKQKGSYSIIAGSFNNRSNAEARKYFLHTNHISSVIKSTIINRRKMYRVEIGTFTNRNHTKASLHQLASLGIDGFIIKNN